MTAKKQSQKTTPTMNKDDPKFTDPPTTWTKEMIDKFNSAPFMCRMPDYAGDYSPTDVEDRKLDAMFAKLDHMLSNDQFEKVDRILARVQPEKMTTVLALGLLSITRIAKTQLPSRAALVDRVEHTFKNRLATRDRVEELLRGLR